MSSNQFVDTLIATECCTTTYAKSIQREGDCDQNLENWGGAKGRREREVALRTWIVFSSSGNCFCIAFAVTVPTAHSKRVCVTANFKKSRERQVEGRFSVSEVLQIIGQDNVRP